MKSTPSFGGDSKKPAPIDKILPTGTTVRHISLDHIHVDFKNIKSVGVANILDIDSHLINTIFNSRSHLIKFRNGGEIAFAYSASGELIELCAKGVTLLIGPNDDLMFSITHAQ